MQQSANTNETYPYNLSSVNQKNSPIIIFTIPSKQKLIQVHYSYNHIQNMYQKTSIRQQSPIKQFVDENSIQQAAQEYSKLFGEESNTNHLILSYNKTSLSTNSHKQKQNQSTINSQGRRRLNLGQKIRNKLQSPYIFNKQQQVNHSMNQVSKFDPRISYQNQSEECSQKSEQKLYESQIQHNINQFNTNNCQFAHNIINENILNQLVPFNNRYNDNQDDQYLLQGQQMMMHQPCAQKSLTSSPFDNISAKTYYSPQQEHNSISMNSSPIKRLDSITEYQNDYKYQQKQLFKNSPQTSQYFENTQVIRLQKVKQQERLEEQEQILCEIRVSNVPMVDSRVIQKPVQHAIQCIQSRCIPCQDQDDGQCWSTSLQYAMQQLSLLQQNVDKLQIATQNLILARSRAMSGSFQFVPSSINKCSKFEQSNLDSSFIQNLIEQSNISEKMHEYKQLRISDKEQQQQNNRFKTPKSRCLLESSQNRIVKLKINNNQVLLKQNIMKMNETITTKSMKDIGDTQIMVSEVKQYLCKNFIQKQNQQHIQIHQNINTYKINS